MHEICEAARWATCGACWAASAEPCTTAPPGGTHLARLARAVRRGLLTDDDLARALAGFDAFSGASVVRPGGAL